MQIEAAMGEQPGGVHGGEEMLDPSEFGLPDQMEQRRAAAEAALVPKKTIPMKFAYGQGPVAGLGRGANVTADNTFDAIVAGERTATTRAINRGRGVLEDVEIGDIIEFERGADKVLVRVTGKRMAKDVTPEEWARVEGYGAPPSGTTWDEWEAGRKYGGQRQITYELLDGPEGGVVPSGPLTQGTPGTPQAAAPTADFETLDFLEGANAELHKGAVTGINLSELDAEITDVAGGWAPSRLSQKTVVTPSGQTVGVSPKTHVQADPGLSYYYTKHMYSKESGDVHDWSPMVTEIKERVEALTGYDFDLVLIQRYPAGETKLGFHRDLEQVFDPVTGEHLEQKGIKGEAVVVSVNFGDTREFAFSRTYDTRGIVGSVDLGDGDVLVMMEGIMDDPKLGGFLHSLRPGSDIGPRINLTFRRIGRPLQDIPRRQPGDPDLWYKAEREFDQGSE